MTCLFFPQKIAFNKKFSSANKMLVIVLIWTTCWQVTLVCYILYGHIHTWHDISIAERSSKKQTNIFMWWRSVGGGTAGFSSKFTFSCMPCVQSLKLTFWVPISIIGKSKHDLIIIFYNVNDMTSSWCSLSTMWSNFTWHSNNNTQTQI